MYYNIFGTGKVCDGRHGSHHLRFESYVIFAGTKAFILEDSVASMFESYVIFAGTKASQRIQHSKKQFESYVISAGTKAHHNWNRRQN